MSKSVFRQFCFYILLGLFALVNKWVIAIWIYYQISLMLFKAIRKDKSFVYHALSIGSMELLGRMLNLSPFIPYDVFLYSIFVLVFPLFRYIFSIRGLFGLLILGSSLIASLYDLSGNASFQNIRFNIGGIFVIGVLVSVALTVKEKLSFDKVQSSITYPLITTLIFLVWSAGGYYTSGEFSFEGNRQFTGGFGPNQVSTVMGVGFFTTVIQIYRGKSLTGFRLLDLILMAGFMIQGLLSFSRGGILVAVISVIVYIVLESSKNSRRRLVSLFTILPILTALLLTNKLTNGMLWLRYIGETNGTLAGSKEKSLDTITTGRFTIFLQDLLLWLEYPIFGVGVGASPYLRQQRFGGGLIESHVELTRLLAEHGIFGILVFVLIYMAIKYSRSRGQTQTFKGLFYPFLLMAVLTSFHAATRTFVTPVFIFLIIILPNFESSLHRK